jgi:thiamine-monophosphate kinase
VSDLSRLGEFGLIDREAGRLGRVPVQPARGEVVLGIGDDAAVVALPGGSHLVSTIDALIEGVHFRRDWSSAADVGWKALAANVSDLGAMGARPVAAVITLALPKELPPAWVDGLYAGLAECAAVHGCPIVGGDTVRSPGPVAISVAAHGAAPEGQTVTRSGARSDDLLCVTGVVGDSAAGLAILERSLGRGGKIRKSERSLVEWHRRPRPPVAAGAALAEAGIPTAMLDLSDGIASDLAHICRRSRVGARVELERLPISHAARGAASGSGADPTDWALHGGEDFQLLLTLGADRFQDAIAVLGPLGVTLTRLGVITRAAGVRAIDAQGKATPLRPRGFSHFGSGSGPAP